MRPQHKSSSLLNYRVRTGLIDLEVEAHSRCEAIAVAREQLCLDLPRLWDLIHELSDDRFQVELSDACEAAQPLTADELSDKNEAA
jgi:hypothetical protein